MATNLNIAAVLDSLRSKLGTGESPPGSNSNFIVSWYNDNVDKIGRGPWCEMTNTWAMWTSGAKLLKKGRAYTVWAAQDGQKGVNGSSWHYGTKGMRAGDQAYFDWKGQKGSIGAVDHTGTVEKIIGDGTFYILEGNIGDKLRRMRRDSKYVVGYVRFDWAKLAKGTPPKPIKKPPVKKLPSSIQVARIQTLLKVTPDGQWGVNTDARARRLRAASRAKVGYPRNSKVAFNIENVQYVIGTSVDGVWGPKSQLALRTWVYNFQRAALVTPDGQWGPRTDNAFLTIRTRNLNKF